MYSVPRGVLRAGTVAAAAVALWIVALGDGTAESRRDGSRTLEDAPGEAEVGVATAKAILGSAPASVPAKRELHSPRAALSPLQRDGTPLSTSERVAEGLQRRKAHLEHLEQVMDTEPVDRAWAADARNALLDRYTGPELEGLGARVESECRSTLCRTVFTFEPDADLLGPQTRDIVARAPWRGQGFTQIAPEQHRAVLYLAREGHLLPQPQLIASASPESETRSQP